MTSKAALRSQMKAALLCLSVEEKRTASHSICSTLIEHLQTKPDIHHIASFAALDLEPCLSELHDLTDCTISYPLVTGEGSMNFHQVDRYESLVTGAYNIPEPNPSLHPEAVAGEIDLILVPAYAYTQAGERLGKGGGFYDRFLASYSGESIGIIFDKQLIQHLITEPHDHSVNATITEFFNTLTR